MRWLSVASEALRNIVTGTSRLAWGVALLAVLVGGPAIAEQAALLGAQHQAQQYRDSGAAIQVLSSDAVDGGRCDALRTMPGITAAGARREAGTVRVTAMPSRDLTVHEVTPGFIHVIAGPDAVPDAGVWLPGPLADTLGAAAGTELDTSRGPMRVAGVFPWPDDGRPAVLDSAIVAPVPAIGSFDACWAFAWPADGAAKPYLYLAVAPGADGASAVGALNTRLGETFDLDAVVAGRLTTLAAAVAAVLGAGIGGALVYGRRLEIASNLHAGVPRSAVVMQALLEVLACVAGAGVLLAGVTLAHVVAYPDAAVMWTWGAGMRVVGAGLAGTVLGGAIAVMGVRERHLFRFFRQR